MPRIEKTHEVPYRAEDMYDLVCDIDAYPQFVPLCRSLSVESRSRKNGKTLVVANMTMAYGMLSETFKTRVLMKQESLEVDVKYVDGPFRHLENLWKFEPLETGGSRILFLIDYELRSRLLAAAAGAVFETAFGRFVDAFEARAQEIYGDSNQA